MNSLRMSTAHNIKAKAFKNKQDRKVWLSQLLWCDCDDRRTINNQKEERYLLLLGFKDVSPSCQGSSGKAK